MSNVENNNSADSSVILKAGIWYTISNFFFRGIGFITTPIFARLLNQSDLGMFTNFTSWLSILLLISSLELHMTVIRSKLIIKDDMDSYLLSMNIITCILTLLLFFAYLILPDLFLSVLQIEKKFIPIMFLYLFFTPAFQLTITKERALYKYKKFTIITGISTITSLLLSLLLTVTMDDKLAGRILGSYIPHIFIGLICFILILLNGKKINFNYMKDAVKISAPLVPHSLSLYLLNSSDKIMITKFSGPEFTAIYSIAYSAYRILSVIFDSMNKARAPWLLDCLHLKNYDSIKKVSKKYVLLFIYLCIFVLLFTPEIIFILGGRKYAPAVYCLPPLVLSVVFQLIYTIFVNVEFFLKESVIIAKSTLVAAIINIVLNLLLIPRSLGHSFIIASYTTMLGYLILLLMHYRTIKKLKMDKLFDIKYFLRILLSFLFLAFSMNILYKLRLVRYILGGIYIAYFIFIIYRNKDILINIIKL